MRAAIILSNILRVKRGHGTTCHKLLWVHSSEGNLVTSKPIRLTGMNGSFGIAEGGTLVTSLSSIS